MMVIDLITLRSILERETAVIDESDVELLMEVIMNEALVINETEGERS